MRWFVSAMPAGALALAQFPASGRRRRGPGRTGSCRRRSGARLLVQAMTLDEKIQMVHGVGWFFGPDMNLSGQEPPPVVWRSNGGGGFIPGIPRLGVPDIQLNDAMLGSAGNARMGRYSTALPSGLALAASWIRTWPRIQALIGKELRDQGFHISLGGGINLTREALQRPQFRVSGRRPAAGRTDDRAVSRRQAVPGIVGLLKHYALNNQETGRHFVNVRISRKAARESELLAFEIVVKEAGRPGSIMCSYNLVEGDYACENAWLLNDVLKKEWGFPGFVMSDWGATHSTVRRRSAGSTWKCPATLLRRGAQAAVEKGEVPMTRLDDMVQRVLWALFRAGVFDRPKQRQAPDIFLGSRWRRRPPRPASCC